MENPKVELKEYWCQENLDFCRPDGTNEALQEVIEILKEEINDDKDNG